jgi:hypothetical protein
MKKAARNMDLNTIQLHSWQKEIAFNLTTSGHYKGKLEQLEVHLISLYIKLHPWHIKV